MAATNREQVPQESFIKRFFTVLAKKTRWRADGSPENYYTRLPHIFWAHLPRLTKGKAQLLLVQYAWRMTVGLERDDKAPAPAKTERLEWRHLAEIFCCSVQEVKDDAKDAAARGLIALDPGVTGGCIIQVLWKDWENIQDYKASKPTLVKEKNPDKEKERALSDPFEVRRGQRQPYAPIPPETDGYRLEIEDGFEGLRVRPVCRKGKMTLKISSLESDSNELSSKSASTPVPPIAHSSPLVKKSDPVKKDAALSSEVGELVNITPLLTELLKYGHTTDATAAKLLENCRANASNCPVEEVSAAVALKAKEIGPNVRQKIAWLLKVVPSCFVGESYRLMKQGIEMPVEDFDYLSPSARASVERLKRRGFK